MCIVKHPINYECSEDGFFYLRNFHDNAIVIASFKSSKPKERPNYENDFIYQMLTSSRVGTLMKARAFAESNNLMQHFNKYIK